MFVKILLSFLYVVCTFSTCDSLSSSPIALCSFEELEKAGFNWQRTCFLLKAGEGVHQDEGVSVKSLTVLPWADWRNVLCLQVLFYLHK